MERPSDPKSRLTFPTTSSILFLTLSHIITPTFGAGIHKFGSGNMPKWCYMSSVCDQSSPTSEWNLGTCKEGKTQSPIDITKDFETLPNAGTIDFKGAETNYDFNEFEIVNNGHSIQLQGFRCPSGNGPSFTWTSRNNSVYTLEQIHFHWGPSDNEGSEHTVGGKGYSMEMHLVHWRTSGGKDGGYKDIGAAVKSGAPDALAVIGIFFQGDDNSPMRTLNPVIMSICKVPYTGNKAMAYETVRLSELLKMQTKAVHYMGSLTTPGCNELVAWLVATEPVKMKKEALRLLRADLKEGLKTLSMNYRKVQPLNGRALGLVEIAQ